MKFKFREFSPQFSPYMLDYGENRGYPDPTQRGQGTPDFRYETSCYDDAI